MNVDNFGSITAIKKVIRIAALIVGLFLAGLAYLQYHQIAKINWNKLQQVSENTITTLSNVIIMQIRLLAILVIKQHHTLQ